MSSAARGRFSRTERLLPPELGGRNELVRAVFQDTEPDTAVLCEAPEGDVYLMPWNGSGGDVAAYAPGESAPHVPTELTATETRELLQEADRRTVRIERTPARHLLGEDGDRDVAVSWHARRRWCERVEETVTPAPRIQASLKDAFELSRNRGWYDPTLDVRICVDGLSPVYQDRLDVDWIVSTTIRPREGELGFEG